MVGDDIATAGAGLIDLLLVAGGELVTVLIGEGVSPGIAEAWPSTSTAITPASSSPPIPPVTAATRC